LYFVYLGALVVYTDLSFETVKSVRDVFSRSDLNRPGTGAIEFHAVDAMHLPFPSCSFDIIYGSAFVHHLEDTGPFFSEVHRCLRPNGFCRFFDQADSPLWDWLKRTVLRPAQLYSHWRYPRSPEDLNADSRGGFNKESLTRAMREHNFKELFFVRDWFLHAIVWRHFGKAVGWKTDAMRKAAILFRITKGFDNLFSGTTCMRQNRLMLIWGFTKC
jgi:SAM-dependent methyltransferase